MNSTEQITIRQKLLTRTIKMYPKSLLKELSWSLRDIGRKEKQTN